jgi:Protein of unknown function (DUF3306)
MAPPPSDHDEGFLRRWARRKQEAHEEVSPAKPQPVAPPAGVPEADQRALAPAPEPPAETERKDAPAAEAPFDPSQLPSVESLTKESDYSMFMRAEVPEDLRQQALRKLWASDPILSAPEILDMHNLDYNNVQTFPEGFKTLYEAGREMLEGREEEGARTGAPSSPTAMEQPGAAPEDEDASPGGGESQTSDTISPDGAEPVTKKKPS